MTEKNANAFKTALTDIYHCGFLSSLEEVEPGVFVGQETQGNDETAVQLAERLGGMIIPGKNGAGITWINGGGKGNPGPHGVLVPMENWRKIRDARNIAWSLDVDLKARPYYTLGGIARAILANIGEPFEYKPSCEVLLHDITYGYHTCKPGLYKAHTPRFRNVPQRDLFDAPREEKNPEHVAAVSLYDVSGYYFEQLRRMESFKVTVARGTLKFWDWTPREKKKFEAMVQVIENTKTLRNTLAGAMAGSLKPTLAFTSSPPKRPKWWETATIKQKQEIQEAIDAWKPGDVRKVNIPGKPGPFRAAGLLLVRSGYELCQEEASTGNALYATTDSVCLPGESLPVVWRRNGFRVRLQGRGDAEICHRGSYRIGNVQTIPYGRGFRSPLEKVIGDSPPVIYYKQWL